MMRVLLVSAAFGLALLPGFALPTYPSAPAPQAMPAMVAATPVMGVVTIVVEKGMFYTNLGAAEQVPNGSSLLVQRGGAVIATARLIKVNELDSIAELAPGSRGVVLSAGDKVIIQDIPTTPQQTDAGTLRPFLVMRDGQAVVCYEPVGKFKPSGRMPYIEPDTSQASAETFFTVATLAIVGLVIAND